MENFTMIPNQLTNDSNLSAKAKGVYGYLKSKPDNWKFYITEITEHFTDGKESIYSAIKELINEGWLVKTVIREKGMFVSTTYKVLTEKGITVNGITVNGITVNGKAVNGSTKNGSTKNGKPATNKTDNNKTDNNNTSSSSSLKESYILSQLGCQPLTKDDEAEEFLRRFNAIDGVIPYKATLSINLIQKIRAVIDSGNAEPLLNSLETADFIKNNDKVNLTLLWALEKQERIIAGTYVKGVGTKKEDEPKTGTSLSEYQKRLLEEMK